MICFFQCFNFSILVSFIMFLIRVDLIFFKLFCFLVCFWSRWGAHGSWRDLLEGCCLRIGRQGGGFVRPGGGYGRSRPSGVRSGWEQFRIRVQEALDDTCNGRVLDSRDVTSYEARLAAIDLTGSYGDLPDTAEVDVSVGSGSGYVVSTNRELLLLPYAFLQVALAMPIISVSDFLYYSDSWSLIWFGVWFLMGWVRMRKCEGGLFAVVFSFCRIALGIDGVTLETAVFCFCKYLEWCVLGGRIYWSDTFFLKLYRNLTKWLLKFRFHFLFYYTCGLRCVLVLRVAGERNGMVAIKGQFVFFGVDGWLGNREITNLGKYVEIGVVLDVVVHGISLDVCCNSSRDLFVWWFDKLKLANVVYVHFGSGLCAGLGEIVLVLSGELEWWMVDRLVVWDGVVGLWRLLFSLELDYRVVEVWKVTRANEMFTFNSQFVWACGVRAVGEYLDCVMEWRGYCRGRVAVFWECLRVRLGFGGRREDGLCGLVAFFKLLYKLASYFLKFDISSLKWFGMVELNVLYGRLLLLLVFLDIFDFWCGLCEDGSLDWLLVGDERLRWVEAIIGKLDASMFLGVKRGLCDVVGFWRLVWRNGYVLRNLHFRVYELVQADRGLFDERLMAIRVAIRKNKHK